MEDPSRPRERVNSNHTLTIPRILNCIEEDPMFQVADVDAFNRPILITFSTIHVVLSIKENGLFLPSHDNPRSYALGAR